MLPALFAVAAVAFVFWFCATAISESDFWWHVSAGRLMRQTHAFIRIDPFAYSRDGLPYLSNHEWLAAILFSLAYDGGGAAGAIVMRSVLVSASALTLLWIARRRLWLYLPLAIVGVTAAVGGLLDRPHLFTFLFFSLSLLWACRLLERRESPVQNAPVGLRESAWLVAAQVLWANLHGGAAILNVVLIGALLLQTLWDGWRSGFQGPAGHGQMAARLAMLGLALLAAMVISPMGIENLRYLLRLQNNTAIASVREWVPRPFATYAAELWLVWVAAIAAVLTCRRQLVFSVVLLGILGYLSRQAYRHEMLLVFGATGLCVFQLEGNARWCEWSALTMKRPKMFAGIVIACVPLVVHAKTMKAAHVQGNSAFGYGEYLRVRGAAEFLKRQRLNERIFNPYEIGGELLGLVWPGQKVFVDGRTPDYDEKFLRTLFVANSDPAAWKVLEERHGFTTAIVNYQEPQEGDGGWLPYIEHLDRNRAWTLVYLDDRAAVYLKDTAATHATIVNHGYRIVSPYGFKNTDQPVAERFAAIQSELRRMAESNPKDVRALLSLGRLYAVNRRFADGEAVLRAAIQRQPKDYRAYSDLAIMLIKNRSFVVAAQTLDVMFDFLDGDGAAYLRNVFADAFARAGATDWTTRYR